MKRLFFLAMVVCASLAGCIAPQANYAPVATQISEPPIGEESIAYVGDNLVRQGLFTKSDAIRLDEDQKIGRLAYTMRKGYYIKTGEDSSSEFYIPEEGKDGGRIDKSAIADPYKVAQAYKSEPKLCVVTVFNVHACNSEAKFERAQRQVISSNAFQQALIYSGKIGNKINIGYREFSSDMARPAFNNDVEYDLSDSKVIGYKGARIEVIEATNEYIKYKVLQNFNKAQI